MGLIAKREKQYTIRENAEYAAQIHAYKGSVYVEIMKVANDKWFKQRGLDDFYNTIMDKSFGSMWRTSPRERDWIKAHAWMNKQFDLIEKYSTVMITRPKHLYDLERMQEIRSK